MSKEQGPGGGRGEAEETELLNADGQSARLVSNTTGEFSLDRAREAFAEADEKEEGEKTDGGA